MSRDLSSSSIPLLCVRFHRKRINTSPRKHFQLITIATSFCFRPTRAKYYFWWPTIKSYDCVRSEILVSIAFCQLHICIWSYQGVDNAPVIAAQVTVREMNTPTSTARSRSRPLSRVSSLNNLISSPPTSNTEQLRAPDNSDIQISWTRQTEQTSECRVTSAPRPDWDYILIARGICAHSTQAKQTKLVGANIILMPVAIIPRETDLSSHETSHVFPEYKIKGKILKTKLDEAFTI